MGVGAVSGEFRRAVFLDRDGVLNAAVVRNGRPFPPASVAELRILPGVASAVRELKMMGFRVCVVTNQPDVARGTQERSVVEAMHAFLREQLDLDSFYVCYHDDADCCGCRKPAAGLLVRAAAEQGIALEESYMVGDRWRDVECGLDAGCTTIFIDRGYREQVRRAPDYRVSDLGAAAHVIGVREGVLTR